MILRSQLESPEKYLGTLIHELSHADSGYGDISRGFETYLTNHIGFFAANFFKSQDANQELRDYISKQEKQLSKTFSLSPYDFKVLTDFELEEMASSKYHSDIFDESMAIYDELLSRHPNNSIFHYKKAQCLIGLKLYSRAKDELEIAIKGEPNNIDFFDALTDIYIENGRASELIPRLIKLVDNGINPPKIYCLIGSLFIKCNNFSDAERWYETSYALGFENEKDYAEYCAILLKNAKTDKAHETIIEALDKFPACARLHHQLAGYYIIMRQFDRALEESKKAVNLNPEKVCYIKLLGALESIVIGNLTIEF